MAFDHEAFYCAFYSTTLDSKTTAIEALRDVSDMTWPDIVEMLNAFSDGAGGCEHAMFSTPDGHHAFVSCIGHSHELAGNAGLPHMAYVEITAPGRVIYTSWGRLARGEVSSYHADDSIEAYAAFARMIWEHQEEERHADYR